MARKINTTESNVEELSKVIQRIELVKVENPVSSNIKRTYFYNITLEGIPDLLLVETTVQIPADEYVGRRIRYTIDGNTNEVSNFTFL